MIRPTGSYQVLFYDSGEWQVELTDQQPCPTHATKERAVPSAGRRPPVVDQRHPEPGGAQRDRGRAAGRAAADDGDVVARDRSHGWGSSLRPAADLGSGGDREAGRDAGAEARLRQGLIYW